VSRGFRCPDADRAGFACGRLYFVDEFANSAQAALVIATRGVATNAQQLSAIRLKGNDLNLRAAPVNADQHCSTPLNS
jgi:hypothetical protein